MTSPISVYFFTLTETNSSEHIYLGSLRDALADRDVIPVDDHEDADVVHLFEVNFFTRETLRALHFPELLRILRSDTPVVVSTDHLYFVDEPQLTGRPLLYSANHRAQRWLLGQCDAVIAISESVRDALEPHVDASKLHVVHHGVDPFYFATEPERDPPYVLHVSLASKRKQPEAIRHVAKPLDHRFVVAGSGWDELIPDTAAYANVETPGFVPEDELVELYARAAVFYFPTLHEGFGLPVLEAMAARCAVVSSDVYSIPEVTGDTAVLCDPADVGAHLEAIRGLLDDADERDRLAGAARDRARAFTWERAAEKTEEVYRGVIGT